MNELQLQRLVSDTAEDLACIFEKHGYRDIRVTLRIEAVRSAPAPHASNVLLSFEHLFEEYP